MKSKIKVFEAYIQNRKIRGPFRDINEFKKCYQPRTNLVKDEDIAHLLIPTVLWKGEEPLPSVTECT